MNRLLLLALLVFPINISAASQPNYVVLEEPGADVPTECAVFFSRTGWGHGKWDGTRPSALWVEKVRKDCTADIVYVWEPPPGSTEKPGFRRFANARIEGKVLSVTFATQQATVSLAYRLSENGNTIAGTWEVKGRDQVSKIELRRG